MKITVLANLMMRYGNKLGMTPTEKDVYWQLLDHDHDGKNYSYPGFLTLHDRTGIESRKGMSEIICSLESKKLLIVHRRAGKNNRYEFTLLRDKLLPYWEQELEKEKSRRDATMHHTVNSEQGTMHQKVNGRETTIYEKVHSEQKTIHPAVHSQENKTAKKAQDLPNHAPNGKHTFVHYAPKGNTNSSISLSSNIISSNKRERDEIQKLKIDFEKISMTWWEEKAVPLWIKNVAPKLPSLKNANHHPGGLWGDPAHVALVQTMQANWEILGEDEFTRRYENFTLSENDFYLQRSYGLRFFCNDFGVLMNPNHNYRAKNANHRRGGSNFIPGKILRYEQENGNGRAASVPLVSADYESTPY